MAATMIVTHDTTRGGDAAVVECSRCSGGIRLALDRARLALVVAGLSHRHVCPTTQASL